MKTSALEVEVMATQTRAWRGQAVGVAPTERLNIEKADGGSRKKESVSLYLFLEVNDLEVEAKWMTYCHASVAGDIWPLWKRRQIQ